NGKLNCAHPTEVRERAQSGAYSTAGKENIVNENDFLVVDVRWEFRTTHNGLHCGMRQIVTIKIDVENPELRVHVCFIGHCLRHALCHRNSTSLNTNQDQFAAGVRVEDFVRQ